MFSAVAPGCRSAGSRSRRSDRSGSSRPRRAWVKLPVSPIQSEWSCAAALRCASIFSGASPAAARAALIEATTRSSSVVGGLPCSSCRSVRSEAEQPAARSCRLDRLVDGRPVRSRGGAAADGGGARAPRRRPRAGPTAATASEVEADPAGDADADAVLVVVALLGDRRVGGGVDQPLPVGGALDAPALVEEVARTDLDPGAEQAAVGRVGRAACRSPPIPEFETPK